MDRTGRSLSENLIANSATAVGTTTVCLGLGGNYLLKFSVRQPGAEWQLEQQTSSRDLSIIIRVLLERISTKKYENADCVRGGGGKKEWNAVQIISPLFGRRRFKSITLRFRPLLITFRIDSILVPKSLPLSKLFLSSECPVVVVEEVVAAVADVEGVALAWVAPAISHRWV